MTSVLIVDDDAGDLEILSRAFGLTSQAGTIVTCQTVDEACDWLDQQSAIDLGSTIIITDLNMPKVDGFDFIDLLRSRQDPPPVVIVLSTSARSSEIDRAYKCGANAYHSKPMGFRETTDLCRSIMDYWTSSAHLPTASPLVKSLIYVSQAVEGFERDELEDLELKAGAKNKACSVTGFLVHHDDYFLQFLEGPQDGLDAIYLRIGSDQRHQVLRHAMLGSSRRRFSGWAMNVLGANGPQERPLTELFSDAIDSFCAADESPTATGPVMELTTRMAAVHQWVGPVS